MHLGLGMEKALVAGHHLEYDSFEVIKSFVNFANSYDFWDFLTFIILHSVVSTYLRCEFLAVIVFTLTDFSLNTTAGLNLSYWISDDIPFIFSISNFDYGVFLPMPSY